MKSIIIARRAFAALAVLAAVFVTASGCGSKPTPIEEFENGLHLQPEMDVAHLFDYETEGLSLKERMAVHGVPGLTLTVIGDGEIDWSKTWGIRDAATGTPVTPETIFEAGSTCKFVTATLVMMLVVTLIALLVNIYSMGYMRAHDEPCQTRFNACFALSIFGAIGVAFSDNLFTLYLF